MVTVGREFYRHDATSVQCLYHKVFSFTSQREQTWERCGYVHSQILTVQTNDPPFWLKHSLYQKEILICVILYTWNTFKKSNSSSYLATFISQDHLGIFFLALHWCKLKTLKHTRSWPKKRWPLINQELFMRKNEISKSIYLYSLK